ncbi:SDR family oxidoreductase [Bacillus pseudomycoides]|uniref:Short-chain dehydrogenase n=1 Tax=Bacillus pseudomycoides TaxID=64104 RepID=A0A2C3XAE3_9BACI|nr:SDR family oxidoreductase [Bacillus pseudomycoides]PDY46776.1 short-chain dehydrogenase [Bacillus pseudomycoides]PEA83162.1 short-chain dehydrogenase [Bacillus pseudomycoides]PED70139.1 short-chain dehydrogenase [Bacillus pseudomycoides]PEE39755.1 short-chain dehydrogenase [Bacillus pseudomycoides]PEI46746.1 short-chain dehydrogenase [Bacillus pseudomycoides]
MKPLQGKVAVVAGATRGAGRGIAMMLGEAGATVYVTGRSTKGNLSSMGRTETIEETAELVTKQGGRGIAVRVDHTVEADIKALFNRVQEEQNGKLDILVNDVWGGDPLTEWEKSFWEHDLHNGLLMQQRAVHSHMMTSYYGVPLMVKKKKGLVIEITDGVDYQYRGNLYYSLAKISTIHLAEAMAKDLEEHHITAVAVSPGFLRSEAMLDLFGVTEENWQEGAKKDPHFIASETPVFIGRAIAALASDSNVHNKTGKALSSWGLAREYGFKDIDGRQPDWGKYFEENVLKGQ